MSGKEDADTFPTMEDIQRRANRPNLHIIPPPRVNSRSSQPTGRAGVVKGLLATQKELLVIEFVKGETTTRYRQMRRIDLLREVRQSHGDVIPVSVPVETARFDHRAKLKRREVVSPVPDVKPVESHVFDKRPPSAPPLQPRDLRILDTSFQVSRHPAFLIRRNCLIINLSPVRALVMPNKCFFFPEEGADSELRVVMDRLRRPVSDLYDGCEEDVPFEYVALEALLMTVCNAVAQQLDDISPVLHRCISRVMSHSTTTEVSELDAMRHLRGRIDRCLHRCKGVRNVLADVCDEPQLLRGLNFAIETEALEGEAEAEEPSPLAAAQPTASPSPITGEAVSLLSAGEACVDTSEATGAARVGSEDRGVPVSAEGRKRESGGEGGELESSITPQLMRQKSGRASVGPGAESVAASGVLASYVSAGEVLLESYLSELEDSVRRCKEMKAELDASEQQLSLQLARHRNILLRVDVGLSIAGVMLGIVASVTSAFGMNVPVPFAEDSAAFNRIVIALFASTTAAAVIAIFFLYKHVR